ncbi:MAG: valine--tRNA ligase [Spirochaetales bacterium]|nr:valine--tRNA ligase [Spirochaetales bacterium]
MKSVELAKAYDPKEFEDRIYKAWKAEGAFKPTGSGKPFVVVIPPPNVTGVLHMGHGLNNSLQDILVRFHRMGGRPTLWVPGTDHAGIATQHVVEKRLREQGIRRHELGREKFVEETWKVKKEHHEVITRQLERIGASCDWSRERFTLDEGLSKAVREVFVTLYERGLIYKGKYLVNWCSSCGTALADDEVEHDDEPGAMYRIRYPFADGSGSIEIATTRPETLLGDAAVACHPDDERYSSLVGRSLSLPLTGRDIPLIADAYVDREFGTGLVKITPAHDPNDFEVGNRHDLPRINILNPNGTLNDEVPEKYRGLSALDARKLVVEDLKALGLFVSEEAITHSVGHCYRCHTVVEPYLSEQWFVKMKPLAEKALKAWRDGDLRFFPQRWENTYEHWMTTIRDWCISRQLWWGHRIPAWHCAHCGKTVVAREEPLSCPYCASTELTQDEDVLDTWFSSWIWPFSVMGWPESTADLRNYYPTSALVTGYDIIFFWVARMVMAGLEFTGQVPFRDVYITTLVRDKQGRKMSKSLGNGIDPLEIVDEYGADALKFTLAFLTSQGQDVLVDKDSFKLGSKFANKVWNASRYILMNLDGRTRVADPRLNDADRWIYRRLAASSAAVADALAAYRFNDAAAAVYEYFWNDFCDWYLEATKLSTRSPDAAEKDRAVSVLLDVLEWSLALIHPFLPFVSEEIYGTLPDAAGRLISHAYPASSDERGADPGLDSGFAALKELVSLVRALRSEFGIAPERKLKVAVRPDAGPDAEFLGRNADLVALLCNAESVSFVNDKPAGALALAGRGFDCYVFAREAVDTAQLAARFRKEADKERQFAQKVAAKLANPGFTDSAPAEVVGKERDKLQAAQARAGRLENYLKDLE